MKYMKLQLRTQFKQLQKESLEKNQASTRLVQTLSFKLITSSILEQYTGQHHRGHGFEYHPSLIFFSGFLSAAG